MQIKINKLDIKSTGFRWENPLLSWNWIRLQYTHLQSSGFILVDQENIRIVYSGCNANELRSPKLCLSASVVFAYALWNTHKISEMCMCYETRGKKYKNMAKIVMQNTWASIMHSHCAVFSMVFPLRMETVLLENAESPFIWNESRMAKVAETFAQYQFHVVLFMYERNMLHLQLSLVTSTKRVWFFQTQHIYCQAIPPLKFAGVHKYTFWSFISLSLDECPNQLLVVVNKSFHFSETDFKVISASIRNTSNISNCLLIRFLCLRMTPNI